MGKHPPSKGEPDPPPKGGEELELKAGRVQRQGPPPPEADEKSGPAPHRDRPEDDSTVAEPPSKEEAAD